MASREIVGQEAQQLGDLLRERIIRPGSPAQRGRGRTVGTRSPPEPEVDAPRGEGVEHPELLRDHQRGMIRQHHPARAEPDVLGVRGEAGEHQWRRSDGQGERRRTEPGSGWQTNLASHGKNDTLT